MSETRMRFAVMLIVSASIIGGVVSAMMVRLVTFDTIRGIERTPPASKAGDLGDVLVFNPPQAQDAPADIREAVMLGYHILTETQKYAADYVGNKLNCTNCHFDGGRAKETLCLVGVAATYPKYRERQHYAGDLETRTNSCFERSMNGRPLPPDSKEMTAIIAYYHWISRNIPIYAKVPWLGLRHLESDHKADSASGSRFYSAKCAVCHGVSGQGTLMAPPLWGPDSFNDGAGMSKVATFAAFTHKFMPRGAADLTVEQALDIAAFGTAQPRPHYEKKKDEEDVE